MNGVRRDTVRGIVNDILRWLIGVGIAGVGAPLTLLHWTSIKTASGRHARLRSRYELVAATPVQSWSHDVERALEQHARAGRGAKIALTSGSAATPKRVPYSGRRLRMIRLAYIDMFVRACWALSIRRRSLYVFASFGTDGSVTSLLVDEPRPLSRLSILQAPYRVQRDPSIMALLSTYGPLAVRLWILTIANPGVLYSTNPSTLSIFLDGLTSDWLRHVRLVRDFHDRPESFEPAVHAIARRLESSGARDRLSVVARSRDAVPLRVFAPSVEAYICWTGGHVKPFLDRLTVHLPPARYRLIPMYSMATETLETVPHFVGDRVAFLPMASGVCYEFIEEGAEDRPENLMTAAQLHVGTAYSMVVSDGYGLRRYQTGDVFLCRGFANGLPDLEFLRRRDLEYSFTGEKLTGEQLRVVFEQLRDEWDCLRSDDFLTCVPSLPPSEPIPHYRIVVASSDEVDRVFPDEEIARRSDRLLGEVNGEYKIKRDSGRLGAVRVVRMPLTEFVDRLGGRPDQAGWESQFKFLPLSRETWERQADHPLR